METVFLFPIFPIVFAPRTNIKKYQHFSPLYGTSHYSFFIIHSFSMLKFIKSFLIFIVLYHILITVVQYGILWWIHPNAPAIIRDAIWLIFMLLVIFVNTKHLKSYLRQWKRPRITFIILVVFSVGISFIKGKNISDIFIGIKYGFLYIPIFLSATFIGHLWSEKQENRERFWNFIKYFLVTTVILGFIWQIAKFIRPDIFLHIGYGPFNDFVFGAKPPIYYLTGYQGTSRRQGLFSWPNNYGYFLIAFLPFMITLCKSKWLNIRQRFTNKQMLRNSIIILLRILAILLTLSRAARIGWAVAIILLNSIWIKKNKKIARWLLLIIIAGLIGLSILKWDSTRIHAVKFFDSIKYIIQQPGGYGLGTSWPAVHHNGTILPENYFIQLLLDIWTIGFLIWALCIRQIQKVTLWIKRYFGQIKNQQQPLIYTLRLSLTIWRIALLIMGLFLHVFEDSMVNYIFFIVRWLATGYLTSYKQTTAW